MYVCGGSANSSIDNSTRTSITALASCSVDYIKQSSKDLKDFTDGNYNRVVYILTLAICSLLLMVSLTCLSPLRQHSRNKILTAALWASQVLPFTVIAHTLGLMQSPPYQNQPYAIWVAICLLIYGISSSRLYGLYDQRQQKMQVLKDGGLLYLAAWSMYLHWPKAMELRVPLLLILGAGALRFLFGLIQICLAYSPTCRLFGLKRTVKLVADFMSLEHDLMSDPADPIKMTGYKYLVKGEENVVKLMANKEDYLVNKETIDETAVTVERIWQCKGKLFLEEGDGEDLKDKCLSFALFRLLAMRFRGFSLPEKHHSKNWNLVRDGLLSKQYKHQRAFRVIEDELSFLYDYFYSQYPLLFSDGKFFAARTAIYTFLEFVQFLAGLCIIKALFKDFRAEFGLRGKEFKGGLHGKEFSSSLRDEELYGFCQHSNGIWSSFVDFDCSQAPAKIHFLGACIFVLIYVLLRILQLAAIAFSNWAKVWLLCEYVGRPCLQENPTLESLIGFVCRCKRIPWKPWRRKMEQYSLLSSYKYRPIFYFLTSPLFELPKRGQESQESKTLDQDVKAAVLDALEKKGPRLTNGLSSLEGNKIDRHLFWACGLKSISNTILVWHVATSFCALDRQYGSASNEEESWKPRVVTECLSRCCGESSEEESVRVKQKREVAECLSGYCAYLVAFVPALLPEPTDSVEVVFDQAILDARQVLGKCSGGRRTVYDELRKLGKILNREDEEAPMGKKPGGEQVVKTMEPKLLKEYGEKVAVTMGAKLGMQLLSAVENDEARLWEVLADFWAEMMLFLTPSNNVMAHARSLANGGEFITHLWALLTHVGGCRQDSDSPGLDDDSFPSLPTSQSKCQSSGPDRGSKDEESNDSYEAYDESPAICC